MKNLSSVLRGTNYGTLPVANGGTGAATLTVNNVLLGNGTSALQVVAPGTSGNVLTSNGTTWVSQTAPISLPTQTGNNGKYLTTDGTTASWTSTVNTAWTNISSTPTTVAGYNITDAYTKTQIDAFLQGLDPKASVLVATSANITLSGTQTIDGVTVAIGDRVLVKNQTTTSDNGLYIVASSSWTRTTDMDAWSEVPGSYVFVEKGTSLADTGWVCTSDQSGTLNTTAITWVQFAGAGSYTAGTGISIAGSQISLTSGVVTTGTYKSVTVDQYGRVIAGTNPTTLAGFGITDAQSTLVSGTNIKSVNGNSLLGSGDLTILTGLAATSIKTSAYTATANDLVRCNTAAGSFSVTLPSSPADGIFIGFFDINNSFGTNNLTILPNGKTIEGDATSYVLDINSVYVLFIFNSSTNDWRLLAAPTATVATPIGKSIAMSIAFGG